MHIQYTNVDSDMRPVPHSDVLPVPQLPVNYNLSVDEETMLSCSYENETKKDYISSQKYLKPHMITQVELNDFVCNLGLSKNRTKFLGSRLQKCVG